MIDATKDTAVTASGTATADPATPASAAGGTPADKAVAASAVATGSGSTDPATKEGATQSTSAAAETAAAKDGVPDKYDLKPPKDSTLTATDLERTAATARALGLSQDHAQQLVDFTHQESAAAAKTAVTAALEAIQPGGAEWKKVTDGWKAETLADPKLGATPEARTQAIQKGHRVVEKYTELHPDDGAAFKQFLNESGAGDHPVAARFFAWLGDAAGEGKLVLPAANQPAGQKSTAELMYGPDGGRPKPAA